MRIQRASVKTTDNTKRLIRDMTWVIVSNATENIVKAAADDATWDATWDATLEPTWGLINE